MDYHHVDGRIMFMSSIEPRVIRRTPAGKRLLVVVTHGHAQSLQVTVIAHGCLQLLHNDPPASALERVSLGPSFSKCGLSQRKRVRKAVARSDDAF